MTVKVYSPVLPSVEVFGAHEGIASATGINQTVSLTFTPTEGTLVVVPYGDTVSQLQLEVGPTPSSYIPTEDAEVTRAADIMTVPAANMPWPEPVVIGEELVTDGGFDSGTDAIAPTTNRGTATVVSGELVLETTSLVGSAGVAQSLADPTITTDGLYVLRFDVISFTDIISLSVYQSTGVNSGLINPPLLSTTNSGSYSVTFNGSAGNTLTFTTGGASVGGTVVLDNISVREINPLAVSIQMDGTVTGADSTLAEWSADASNNILVQSGSTDFTFTQEAAGVVDTVIGGSFTAGINIPFNIASYHSSISLNGAVDGVALTANTTPTALPDLSATDFEIAPTFMGNISKLRVWADDIGDDGIEQASGGEPSSYLLWDATSDTYIQGIYE